MFQQLRAAMSVLAAFSLLTGFIYPMAMTGMAQALFPFQANGSLLKKDEVVVGSVLIGQNFTSEEYFWGRLSATSPVPYNASSSGGSNLGPMNEQLVALAKTRIDALKAYKHADRKIPVDLVTSSGSGLDPHISPAAAKFQMERIANHRKMDVKAIEELVDQQTSPRQLGFLGEPCINVLQLNMELDQLQKKLQPTQP